MPFGNIKLIDGVFSDEQKQQMIERVTEAMISVEGENLRPLTLVVIDDNVKSGDWGLAGHGATAQMIHAIQQGKPPDPSIGNVRVPNPRIWARVHAVCSPVTTDPFVASPAFRSAATDSVDRSWIFL
jgi:4-oxalocrotonate tautomerase